MKKIFGFLSLMAWVMTLFGATVTEETNSGRTAPGWKASFVNIPGALAADATLRYPIFVAPFNMELGEVALINSTLVTGHDTDYKNINLIDGGAEGAGTSELANRDLRATGTVNLDVGKTLLLDATSSGEVFMSQGDILEIEFEQGGSGVLIEPLGVQIAYRRANLSS
jgi:hypothetical protein|tara:strand:- start:1098 stop:1601 length:504 start_codon:yes stop_codon:yes gene_type:complete